MQTWRGESSAPRESWRTGVSYCSGSYPSSQAPAAEPAAGVEPEVAAAVSAAPEGGAEAAAEPEDAAEAVASVEPAVAGEVAVEPVAGAEAAAVARPAAAVLPAGVAVAAEAWPHRAGSPAAQEPGAERRAAARDGRWQASIYPAGRASSPDLVRRHPVSHRACRRRACQYQAYWGRGGCRSAASAVDGSDGRPGHSVRRVCRSVCRRPGAAWVPDPDQAARRRGLAGWGRRLRSGDPSRPDDCRQAARPGGHSRLAVHAAALQPLPDGCPDD
jgi:hypothetical protein